MGYIFIWGYYFAFATALILAYGERAEGRRAKSYEMRKVRDQSAGQVATAWLFLLLLHRGSQGAWDKIRIGLINLLEA